jgi:hypothetical protein
MPAATTNSRLLSDAQGSVDTIARLSPCRRRFDV